MKLFNLVFMALVIAATSPAFADEQPADSASKEALPVAEPSSMETQPATEPSSAAEEQAAPAEKSRGYGAGDIAADVFLRPAGFIATVIGAGLYLTFLPPVALNSIYPPHDPIVDWAELMIVNPGEFTFTRPIGDYSYPQSKK